MFWLWHRWLLWHVIWSMSHVIAVCIIFLFSFFLRYRNISTYLCIYLMSVIIKSFIIYVSYFLKECWVGTGECSSVTPYTKHVIKLNELLCFRPKNYFLRSLKAKGLYLNKSLIVCPDSRVWNIKTPNIHFDKKVKL